VLVNQKYVAHIVAITAYVFIALASMFGVEHNLLIYGAGPAWSYSEMRGFGPTLGPWAWFKLYWTAWAIVLLIVARLLWARGKETGAAVRLRLARQQFAGRTRIMAIVATAMAAGVGSYVFYNTNILNEYRTASELSQRSAEYERRYQRFAAVAQPLLTKATLRVDIHPEQRRTEVGGTYRLVNRSRAPIDSIHVATMPGVETRDLRIDRAFTLVLADTQFGHHIFVLQAPLEPGDSLNLAFDVLIAPRGFRENGVDGALAANGTYFTNAVLPALGYQASRELIHASDRREQGLDARPLIPYLDDEEARRDRGAGIEFEAIVGTTAEQVGVAPGALRRTWTEGGRRYFEYATQGRIGGEWSFFSAKYAVHEARWNDVTISIYHHPTHTAPLERMVRGIQSSLEYFSTQFGPYLHSNLTVVERPGNGTGIHADASMLSYAEGFATWNPGDEAGSLDFPNAIIAHEVAHQWTVPYAPVEGAPVMSEGVAWYYAIKAVEHSKGVDEARRLLRYLRQPHLIRQIRRGEPLMRGLDPYLSRRRAPFALYALSEYTGEAHVNAALRRVLETHRPSMAPLATTRDLYRELQAEAPDSLRYLLHDFFEVNAFWDLQAETAHVDSLPGGNWRVTLVVHARKRMYDSTGAETDMVMNELVPIGVFGERAGEVDAMGAPLYVQLHHIRSGKQTIRVIVPKKPAAAGIDPHHLLDWEESGDGRNVVEIIARKAPG
jgi:hypothetical protein